jgi:hypothetical protein
MPQTLEPGIGSYIPRLILPVGKAEKNTLFFRYVTIPRNDHRSYTFFLGPTLTTVISIAESSILRIAR